MIPLPTNASHLQPDALDHGNSDSAGPSVNEGLPLAEKLEDAGAAPGASNPNFPPQVPGASDDADEDQELMNELDSEMGGDRNGHQPVAEFLYQLTKMLTDDNTEVIEWSDSRIKVHDPQKLEGDILHKYFRHSKFASFQRQLNYFGFRKIAGKGKMSPCSYVNDGATTDIRSLLLIKRKTNGSAARKAAIQQRSMNPLLGLNLQTLAAAGQQMNLANLGGQAFGNMGGPSLANAMALLSENALRAGLEQMQSGNGLTGQQLGLLALQQQQQQYHQLQQQQQLLQHNHQQPQQSQQTQLHQHLLQLQQSQQQQQNMQQPTPQPQVSSNLDQMRQGLVGRKGLLQSNSLDQLAQLTAQLHEAQQQQNNNVSSGDSPSTSTTNIHAAATSMQSLQNNLNMILSNQSASGAASSAMNPASAALLAQQRAMGNPASAALQAMDGASGGATAAAANSNNLFESALNLKSLLQEHQESAARNQAANGGGNNISSNQGVSSRLNQHRLGSSNAMFPDNMSTLSLGNLLGSSNRLNSLLSLNSLMGSREPSLADFAALNGMHQFPYHAQFPPPGATTSAGNGGAVANAPMSAADLAQRLRQANYS
ncbi:hypothetical protein MPSEU_000494100 [Mayamaea pseudoterrestris]|nr:hypothetical protein MPSEU_000494100 [Mayamaea pseudoterrestris]